jgi:nucleoside 2-deoxyribosyltransferase
MAGCRIPWEDRPSVSIYVAAPDFDWVDTTLLDQLETALRYHNFSPHRPVKENGQVDVADGRAVAEAFVADMELLTGARLVIGVRLFNDVGMLLEVGWAAGRGIPVILWDPSGRFDNVWIAELPDRRATTLEEVVRQVFSVAGSRA